MTPKRSTVPLRSALLLASALAILAASDTRALAQSSATVNASVDTGIGASHTPRLERRNTTLEPVPEDFASATLSPGYLLSMDVLNVPEFSSLSLRVDAHGNVTIPSAGVVHVSGDTVVEAQARIAAKLVEQQILVAPQVQLNVLQFATSSITVLGEVQSPGRVQMLASRNLADVLALAGGETIAAGNDIEIERGDADGHTKVQHVSYTQEEASSKLRQVMILPGDTVVVHKAAVIYVLGAVNKPGGYLMINGGALNVVQALTLAGGTTLEAAMGGIQIYRPEDGVYKIIKTPFQSVTKGEQAGLKLQLNDVLYVPRSRMKTVLVDGSYLLGTGISGALYRAP